MTELKVTAEPGVPQILTERAFDAPRDLILRAFTEADLLAQWLGPRACLVIGAVIILVILSLIRR